MLIDWFTVAAQAVNFLVLVALLRWLLYDRIIGVMEEREEKISSRLEEAEKKDEEAQEKIREYEERKEKLDQKKESILEEAREEAEEKRKIRLSEVREEVETARSRWKESLRREKESFLEEVRRRAGGESVELTRMLLKKLAGSSLESRMVASLDERLRSSGGEERERISGMFEEDGPIIVRSAFELDDAQQDSIRETIDEMAVREGDENGRGDNGEIGRGDNGEIEMNFEVEEELVCGIELEGGGRKIGWSIDESLDELREEFARLIEERAREREEDSGEKESDGEEQSDAEETNDEEDGDKRENGGGSDE